MFKYTRTFFLFEMLVVSLRGVDLQCCPEIQNSLEAVKLDNEILMDLVGDLRARLGSSFEWPPSKNALCPPGFTYLPSAAKCYKVVFESHDWWSAGRKCQWLHRGSNLATITSAAENSQLKTFLASELSKNVGNTACLSKQWSPSGNLFWTSGQRQIENCQSPFVWKPSSDKKLRYEFTNWAPGEPSCSGNIEFCMHLWAIKNYGWNDGKCNDKICPLCEYIP